MRSREEIERDLAEEDEVIKAAFQKALASPHYSEGEKLVLQSFVEGITGCQEALKAGEDHFVLRDRLELQISHFLLSLTRPAPPPSLA